MNKKEQPGCFYIADKIIFGIGIAILLYRKGISESSIFFKIHFSPLILSAACFFLCTFILREKTARYCQYYRIQVYISIITIFATIAAIYDQLKNFM